MVTVFASSLKPFDSSSKTLEACTETSPNAWCALCNSSAGEGAMFNVLSVDCSFARAKSKVKS